MGARGSGAKPVKAKRVQAALAREHSQAWLPSMSRSERVISFCESLPVTSRLLAGTNYKLGEFQKSWIRRRNDA